MDLSRKERWLLCLQLEVLEKLTTDAHEKATWKEAREVFSRGYEAQYDKYLDFIYDGADKITESDHDEVMRILAMFEAVGDYLRKHPVPAGVPATTLEFGGFDNNTESKYVAYVEYLERHEHYDQVIKGRYHRGMPNSLVYYRRQLAAWNGKSHLSEAMVRAIAEAPSKP